MPVIARLRAHKHTQNALQRFILLRSGIHRRLGPGILSTLMRSVRVCSSSLSLGSTPPRRVQEREMAAMATTAGMLRSKAPLVDNRGGLPSRAIAHSGAGKARVSFGKPFCAWPQRARIPRRPDVQRTQWPLQVAALGDAEGSQGESAVKAEEPASKTEEKKEETAVKAEDKKEEQTVAKAEDKKEEQTAVKTKEYSATMQQATGTSLEYRHELGMNYAHVLPDLIVGSCLQTPLDADKLKAIGVGIIFCLQQNPDLAYFGVNLPAIQQRVNELDGITHYRCQIRDFDPYDLRIRLPVAVAQLHKAIEANKGKTAYIHCTAGLGRAPGVALAYMNWLRGLSLKDANDLLQKVRRCHPKLESIRAATADLLVDQPKQTVELKWWSGPTTVEIAGLDAGWGAGQKLPLEFRQKENQWVLRRELPVGRYEYKYIVDGVWMTNSEAPLSEPNTEGQVNNVLEVVDKSEKNEASKAVRDRIMQEDTDLTLEERAKIRAKLEEIANSGQW